MPKIYILDSRRSWRADGETVYLFKTLQDLREKDKQIHSDDLVLLHIGDIKGIINELPEKIGSGQCPVVFYTGGGREEVIQFKNTINDQYTLGRRLQDQFCLFFYDTEAMPNDPYQSLLWKYSIEPFLKGERKKFSIITPALIQYALASKILMQLFFAHKLDASLEGSQQWSESEKIKAFWRPLFDSDVYNDFKRDDPYGWFEKLAEIKKIYESDAPAWNSLQYEDFRPLIEGAA